MTGAHTVSLVGSYDTIELAIAQWTLQNVTAVTDHCEIIIDPGIGAARYHLIKVEVAA